MGWVVEEGGSQVGKAGKRAHVEKAAWRQVSLAPEDACLAGVHRLSHWEPFSLVTSPSPGSLGEGLWKASDQKIAGSPGYPGDPISLGLPRGGLRKPPQIWGSGLDHPASRA